MACNNCQEEEQDCTCVAGQRGSIIRSGNGIPSIISTDLAGDLYIELDSSPTGEIWQFDGVAWIDTGIAMTGDTGAAGASGGNILDNPQTTGTTTGLVYETLNTFSIPLATLTADGDEAVITTRFSMTATNNIKGQRVQIGGVTLIGFEIGMVSERYVTITSTISRVNSTTVNADSILKIFNSTDTQVGGDYSVYTTGIGVADLDTNALVVTAQGKSFTVIGDIVNNFLTVEYKHLV